MQMTAVIVVTLFAAAAAAARPGATPAVLFSTSEKAIVDPADMKRCVEKVSKFLKEPAKKSLAIDKATDDCAVAKMPKGANYVCPHVKDLLTAAFRDFAGEMDAAKFCEMSEFHTLRMRGATRVPNIGRGSLLDYKIKKDCEPAVLGAMAPSKKLKTGEVSDFWYSLCINQDCAHLLPSRTKWCKVDRAPTHGIEVCDLARKFAGEKASSYSKGDEIDAKGLCNLYDGFVDGVKADVESYDNYVHGRSRETVPVPDDDDRALNSAKMMNDASAHKLRDNSGKQVKPQQSGAAAAGSAAALTALVLLA